MAATIKDVARRARVSIASVSRALNNSSSVTPNVRERVLRAASRLHYTPHAAARSLIIRRTHTIGLLLPDIHGEYFSELIRGVDRAARARGLHLLVSSTHGNNAEAAEALRSMNGRVDGLLMMSPYIGGASLEDALPSGLPTVLMNTHEAAGIGAAFVVDDFGGARAMTAHLVAAGYQDIAHIRGPANDFQSLERVRGYRAGLGAGRVARVIDGDFTEGSGYLAGRVLAASGTRPQAVFAANDMMAIGCLFALTEAGVRVPHDIALAGFDDIPLARFVSPPLTTVRVEVAEMGRRALESLIVAIADPDAAGRSSVETVPVELVVRASCGAHSGGRARYKEAGD